MSISTKLTRQYDKNVQKAQSNAVEEQNFINQHPFLYNNPIMSNLVAGTALAGKYIGDLERNAFPSGLPQTNNFNPNINQNKPILGSNLINNVDKMAQISPNYNAINGLAQLAPQALGVEAIGGEALAQKVGSLANSALSKYGNTIAEKVIQKTIPMLSKSAVRAATFTATDPRALTGGEVTDKNTFQNINPTSLTSSYLNNLGMFAGFDTAGSLLKGLRGMPIDDTVNTAQKTTNNIKENAKNTFNNVMNKIKPKYNIKGEKLDSRTNTPNTEEQLQAIKEQMPSTKVKDKSQELSQALDQHIQDNASPEQYQELKDKVNFTAKTRKEHVAQIKTFNSEIEKATKRGDIQNSVDLQNQKTEYINRLYKDIGYSNSEQTTRLMDNLSTIERKLEKAQTNTIQTNDNANNIAERGKVKKVNGKIQTKRLTGSDIGIINEYQKTMKAIDNLNTEKIKLINKVFNSNGGKIFDEIQRARINEHIQKYNDLMLENAANIDVSNPENIHLTNDLQKYGDISPLHDKTIDTNTNKVREPTQDIPNNNAEVNKANNIDNLNNAITDEIVNKDNNVKNTIKKDNKVNIKKEKTSFDKTKIETKRANIEKMVQDNIDNGYTKQQQLNLVDSKKWSDYTKKQVKIIINKLHDKADKEKVNIKKSQKETVNKTENDKKIESGSKKQPQTVKEPKETSTQKKEQVSDKKEPPKKIVKDILQDKINHSTKIAFEYVKHHVKNIKFNLKAKEPRSNNIFKASFQSDNHTMNFLNETRILAHELTHLFIHKTMNVDILKDINIPQDIKQLYKDKSEEVQKEEVLALYTELRAMQDLMNNSNLSKLVDDNKGLNKDIQSKINKIFGNDINNLEKIYKEQLQYNVFNNIKDLHQNSLFNSKYFIEQADSKVKDTIDSFLDKTYKTISKNQNIKNFVDKIKGYDFVKNAIADYKISHSPEKIYTNIRQVISDKNVLMNTIKHVNNTFVKMVSTDFKNIDLQTQKHIHDSSIIDSFVKSGYENLKDFADTLITSKKNSIENFIENNINKNHINDFKKIIEASSEPMNNNINYFKNSEQIVEYLKGNNFLKKGADNFLANDIDNLLTSEYLSNHKINTDVLKHLTNKSDSILAIQSINELAKETLGRDYIRGYKSFIPKKAFVSKLGLYDVEPTYETDLRAGIDNNLLEFKQNGIIGAEYRISELSNKNIAALKIVENKLKKLKINYTKIINKEGQTIGF